MRSGTKRRVAGWSILLAAIALPTTAAWSVNGAAPVTYRSLADRAGDVVDSSSAPLNDPRGDIL